MRYVSSPAESLQTTSLLLLLFFFPLSVQCMGNSGWCWQIIRHGATGKCSSHFYPLGYGGTGTGHVEAPLGVGLLLSLFVLRLK